MFPDVDIDLPIWRCGICGNGIKWVRDNIFYHLRTHHFTLESYRRVYIEGKGGGGLSAANESTAASAASMSRPLPQLLPIQNSGSSAADVGAASPAVKEKKFRCKICGLLVTFNTEAIRSHLQEFHNMSLNEYKPIYTTGLAAVAASASGGGEKMSAGDSGDVQLRMPKLFQSLSQV
jgi:hypothetical protein